MQKVLGLAREREKRRWKVKKEAHKSPHASNSRQKRKPREARRVGMTTPKKQVRLKRGNDRGERRPDFKGKAESDRAETEWLGGRMAHLYPHGRGPCGTGANAYAEEKKRTHAKGRVRKEDRKTSITGMRKVLFIGRGTWRGYILWGSTGRKRRSHTGGQPARTPGYKGGNSELDMRT